MAGCFQRQKAHCLTPSYCIRRWGLRSALGHLPKVVSGGWVVLGSCWLGRSTFFSNSYEDAPWASRAPVLTRPPFPQSHDSDYYEVLFYNGTKSTSSKILLNGLEQLRTHLLPPRQSLRHLFSSSFLSPGSPGCPASTWLGLHSIPPCSSGDTLWSGEWLSYAVAW